MIWVATKDMLVVRVARPPSSCRSSGVFNVSPRLGLPGGGRGGWAERVGALSGFRRRSTGSPSPDATASPPSPNTGVVFLRRHRLELCWRASPACGGWCSASAACRCWISALTIGVVANQFLDVPAALAAGRGAGALLHRHRPSRCWPAKSASLPHRPRHLRPS